MIAALFTLLGCGGGDFVRPGRAEPNVPLEIPSALGPVLMQPPWLTQSWTQLGANAGDTWAISHRAAGWDRELQEFDAHWEVVRMREDGSPETLPPPPLPLDGEPSADFVPNLDTHDRAVGAIWRDDPDTSAVDPFVVGWSDLAGRWDRYELEGLDPLSGRNQLFDGALLTGIGTANVGFARPGSVATRLDLDGLTGTSTWWAGPSDGARLQVVHAPTDTVLCSGIAGLEPLAWTQTPVCYTFPFPHGGVRSGALGGTVDEVLFVEGLNSVLMVGRPGGLVPVAHVPGGMAGEIPARQHVPGALLLRLADPDVPFTELITVDGTYERYARTRFIDVPCDCDRVTDPEHCACVARSFEPTIRRTARRGRVVEVFSDRIDLSHRLHARWSSPELLEATALLPWTPSDGMFTVSITPVTAQGDPCVVTFTGPSGPIVPVGDAYTYDTRLVHTIEVDCAATDGHAPYLGATWTLDGGDIASLATNELLEPFTVRGTPLDAASDPPVLRGFVDLAGLAVERATGWVWLSRDGGLVEHPLPGRPRALSDGRLVFDGGAVWDPVTRTAWVGFDGLILADALREDTLRGTAWEDGATASVWSLAGGPSVGELVPGGEVLSVDAVGGRWVEQTALFGLAVRSGSETASLDGAYLCTSAWLAEDSDVVFALCPDGVWRWAADGEGVWTGAVVLGGHQGWGLFDPLAGALGVAAGVPAPALYRVESVGEPVATDAIVWLASCGADRCVGQIYDPAPAVVTFGLDGLLDEVAPGLAESTLVGTRGEAWLSFPNDGWYRAGDPVPGLPRVGHSSDGPFPVEIDPALSREEVRAYAAQPLVPTYGIAAFDLDPVAFAAAATPLAPGAGTDAVVHPAHLTPAMGRAPCVVMQVQPIGDGDPVWVCGW